MQPFFASCLLHSVFLKNSILLISPSQFTVHINTDSLIVGLFHIYVCIFLMYIVWILKVEDVIKMFSDLHAKHEVKPSCTSYEKLLKYCCESHEVCIKNCYILVYFISPCKWQSLSFLNYFTKYALLSPKLFANEQNAMLFMSIQVVTALDLVETMFEEGLAVSIEAINYILRTCEETYNFNLVSDVI